MKKTSLLLLVLILVALFSGAFALLYPQRPAETKGAFDLAGILDRIQAASGDDQASNLSSNPYSYFKDNADYKALVARGYKALPALSAELDESNDNGLREYIVCAAIEAITHCDLKQFPAFAWDRATIFRAKWDEYLNCMPERVANILRTSASAQSKCAAIGNLGAPAVPYLLKQAASLSQAERDELGAAAYKAAGKPGGGSLDDFSKKYAAEMAALLVYIESR